jgi:hypothetical protein
MTPDANPAEAHFLARKLNFGRADRPIMVAESYKQLIQSS